MDQLGEAEHVAVVVDESVHLAELDVADTVIDLEQRQAGRGRSRVLHPPIAGRERAVVVAPVDERVQDLAVRPDRGLPERAVLAAIELGRDKRRDGAARGRLAPGQFDVADGEGDVVHPVAVFAHVLGDLAVGSQGRREHDPDVVLDHDVAGPVADLRLEPAERDRGEAPQGPVIGRRLARVADPELDVVDAVERQEVGGLGVGVRVDPGAGLVGRASRDGLRHRGSPSWRRDGRTAGATRPHVWPPMLPLACQTGLMTTDDFDRRLADVADRLTALRPVLEGREWPLAERFDHAPEASWGPREVLAHLEEMFAFWLGEAERVVDMTAGPEPFGRVGTDDVRVAVIGRDRTLPVRELLARIFAGIERWRRRWPELSEAERARTGLHPTQGELTVDDLATRFVADHAEGHLDQLGEILGQ